ncbi:MAG: hypothetical protein KDK64_00090 [Chlamydiia bacterium]|nr:hypothetical protein [Chlamydiia bacterium]
MRPFKTLCEGTCRQGRHASEQPMALQNGFEGGGISALTRAPDGKSIRLARSSTRAAAGGASRPTHLSS